MEPERSISIIHATSMRRRIYVVDVTIRGPARDVEEAPPAMKGLYLFGVLNHGDGKRVPLCEISPGHWTAPGVYELDHDRDGIDCVLTEGDSDIGFAHLSYSIEGHTEGHCSPLRANFVTFDDAPLTITWDIAYIPEDSRLPIGNEIPEDLRPPTEDRVVFPVPPLFASYPTLASQLQSALVLSNRAEVSKSVSDLSKAISIVESMALVATDGHPLQPVISCKLGAYLMIRFSWAKDLSDLDRAITVLSKQVDIMPRGHPDIAAVAQNLSAALVTRLNRGGDASLRDRAIFALQKAIMPDCHGMAPNAVSTTRVVESVRFGSSGIAIHSLGCLGDALRGRFDESGRFQDATERVAIYRKSLALTPFWHPSVPTLVTGLGMAYADIYTLSGNIRDVNDAITAQQTAIRLTRGLDVAPISELGNALLMRYQRVGDLADLDGAVEVLRQAVGQRPQDKSLLSALNNLGTCLRHRFNASGSIEDITEAIAALHRVVGFSPASPKAHFCAFMNLAAAFLDRFALTGDYSDVSEGISSVRSALRLVDSPSYETLYILGCGLSMRFMNSTDIDDINEAISLLRQATTLIPRGHHRRQEALRHLGGALVNRWSATKESSDIDGAVLHLEEALKHAQGIDAHNEISMILDDLGSIYSRRLNLTGRREGLVGVVEFSEPTSSMEEFVRALFQKVNQGILTTTPSAESGADGEKVIACCERAVDLTPPNHPDLTMRLIHLCQGIDHKFVTSSDFGLWERSISILKRGATSSAGRPCDKLWAAAGWAMRLSVLQLMPGDVCHALDTAAPKVTSSEIMHAFNTAIDLLALVAGLECSVEHRHQRIQEYCHLPLYGVVVACQFEMLGKAIEWLEQGRCLVWGQLSTLRNPLDALRIHDGRLAQKVAEISKRLETAGITRKRPNAGMPQSQRISLEAEARSHLQLAHHWEDLLSEVRAIPGLEHFLRPKPCFSILSHLPQSGPVVVINVHQFSCDGLALLAGLEEPLHVQLPDLSSEKIATYQRDLVSHLAMNGVRVRGAEEVEESTPRAIAPFHARLERSESVARRVLRCLWLELVRPVLIALGFHNLKGSPPESLPRIWWCPTGPLSFLPIHAAGIYGGPDCECLMDYAVSSYTPSVTAITDRVQRTPSLDREKCGLLLTCQPQAPGAARIPGTTKEVDSIHKKAVLHQVRALRLDGDALSAEDCLKRMESLTSVHLACHASQNAAEPLQSRFRFHKGFLTLNAIMQKDFKHADLAFLSACQTSTGESKLPEEAVHLAAGMLAAGYRRVVATMWSINDSYAPGVADDFYKYLWTHRDEGSGSYFDGSLSAHALHHAIQNLRTRLGSDSEYALLSWVPYVHFGY